MLVIFNCVSLALLLLFSLFSFSLSNPDFTTLLAFKHSADHSLSLSSWSNTSAHCSWTGVTCNPATRRVVKLVLNHLNLTGSIQPLTALTNLRHLSLHHNHLSSANDVGAWPNLKHLYLSHNRFAGKFPAGILRLRHLHRLDLSHNHFSGEIPISDLANLPQLLTLRLEFNSFTGSLTSDQSISTSISDFNVSNNYLIGKIPNALSMFPTTSFSGNRELCGKPLPSNCSRMEFGNNQTVQSDPVGTLPPGERKKKGLSDRAVLTIIFIDVVAVALTVTIVAWCCYNRGFCYRERKREGKRCKKPKREKEENVNNSVGRVREDEEMVYFEGCRGFEKVDDLLKASAEMLGKGSVGTTYKAVMDGGDVVVVKRVRERRKRKEADWFLRAIGGLRHPNIVSLRAFYSSRDELLLVYDFLPNGSLHSLLHGNRGPGRTPLDWTTRLKLARGSAKGLTFLHSQCKSKLFHGHLTSSNIIVDNSGNACITDIGLHQFLPFQSPSNNAYRAPELLPTTHSHHRKLSQKCDVYNFGVVLLEILTGKMATSGGELGLAKWVQRVSREDWTWEVFDFELLRYKEMGQEMVALLQVALLCLATSPRDRPTMATVCGMIEDIRTKERAHTTLLNNLSSDSSPSLSESTPNFTSS